MKREDCLFCPPYKNKRGSSMLKDTVLFLILNLAYFSILILFLLKQGNGTIVLEQAYAKNIAILIDAAKPVMEITFSMEQAFNLAEKNGVKKEEIATIKDNVVTVKLSPNGGYSYSFFNDVEVVAYPSLNKNYTIMVNEYK